MQSKYILVCSWFQRVFFTLGKLRQGIGSHPAFKDRTPKKEKGKMKLSEHDVELFYRLMIGLQFFVNCEKNIIPYITTHAVYEELSIEKKSKVRSKVYNHPELIDAFVQKNPENFSEEELNIIAGWKNYIQGDFFIERFLKKHTIFIMEDQVYAVHGLHNSFEEMIHRSRLPFYVNTVLLPFKGKIIYDGMFEGRNVYFGGGVKRDLKERYMRAKQNDRIIASLDNAPQTSNKKQAATPAKDWQAELNELAGKAKKLRGGASQPPLHSPAFSLVKASVEFAQLAVEEPPDLDALYRALHKVDRATSKVEKVLDRVE